MSRNLLHSAFLTLLLSSAVCVAMGSSSGSAEDKNKNKFSLKNLSKLSKYSLGSLRYNTFQYKGAFELNAQPGAYGGVQGSNSIIYMQNGNTTYIYPYKFKVKVPRFKTPTPPSFINR